MKPPILTTVILALLLYGVAMCAASFVPVHAIAGDLGQFSGGGDASAEIAARFGAIAARARLAGVVIACLAVAALTQRQRLEAAMAPTAAPSLRPAFARLRHALSTHRLLTATLPPLALIGTVLRLYYLNRPMRHDEAWTYMDYARMPLYAIPVRYTDVNDHVLNTLLIHGSVALFGNAPAAIRLPALCFGLLVLPAGFVLACALAGARAGLLATALLASAVPLIEFSVNARGYQALTFFFLLCLGAGHYALASGSRAAWLTVIAAGTLGLYTIPTMMIPLAAAFTWFALLAFTAPRGGRAASMRAITTAGAAIVLATVLLYLPIFIANGPEVLLHSQGIHSATTFSGAVAALPRYAASLLQHWTRGYGAVLVILVPLMVLFAAFMPSPSRKPCALFLAATAAAILFQLLLLKDTGPYRIWLPFLAALLVLAAIGLEGAIASAASLLARNRTWATPLTAAAAVAMCLFIAGQAVASRTILLSDETAFYPPARRAAEALRSATQADIIGITAVRADEILYYALRDGIALRPLSTGSRLRYFRRVAPSQPTAPRALILLVDGDFDHCRAAACAALSSQDFPSATAPMLLGDDAGLTVLRMTM